MDDRCEYCRIPQVAVPFLTFHIEHIQASQHMRDDSLDNLCLACPYCIPLFHPREHFWDEHFRFEEARIEGRTSTGTATARLLKMNAEDQVEVRAALMLRGEF